MINNEEPKTIILELDNLNSTLQIMKDKPHASETLVNVLKESGLIAPHFKEKAIIDSLKVSIELFKEQIKYTPSDLIRSQRKKSISIFFWNLCFSILSLIVGEQIIFGFYKEIEIFLDAHNFVGTLDIVLGLICFVVMVSWNLSGMIYRKYIDHKEMRFKKDKFFTVWNLYILIWVWTISWFVPLLYSQFSGNLSYLVIYLIKGIGSFLIPFYIFVTLNTIRKILCSKYLFKMIPG